MLGIAFFKGQPTDYIIKYAGGRAVRQGLGQSFYYVTLNTQVAVIPTSTRDASFVFNELTNNFQSVTLQGQFTFRISDPAQAATQLNFAWNTKPSRVRRQRPGQPAAAHRQCRPDGDPARASAAHIGADPAAVPGHRRGRAGAYPGGRAARPARRRADQSVLFEREADARSGEGFGGAVPRNAAASGRRSHLRPARGGGGRGAQDQGKRRRDADCLRRAAPLADCFGRRQCPDRG